ncbi:hypothetical protein E6Q11_02065 [Candidatus Dojkabacteria bacterium]|jgi:hypothetical protein|uniref:Uncharacterized protein n=1 Tax=Candidatus Dojkabacteria bacterium TaxID=2099670 RepID=A0A5C7J8J7_9BACT|nr:MAG: hypothetical protein E6Q11_02065 [Candidatus Dojkabacteria bacterium]
MKICISDKIRIEFTVKKSTSLAWEYLTHQKHITKWWGDNVTLENRLGGIFIEKSVAKMLTKTPEKFEPEKFRKLFHKWRYSEAQYQHAINIIGYFNYTNRLAFGMGITLEEGYEQSCN